MSGISSLFGKLPHPTRHPSGPIRVARFSDATMPPLDLSIPPWPGERVHVNGVELFVRRTPPVDGHDVEPALYLHGLGGASTNWTDFAGLLAPWLDGHAIDLPGFGMSGPPPDRDYSQRAHVRTVIAYLERSDRGPVHLFGNSMGGALAIRLAAQRPDLIRTLTLISPAVPDLRPERVSMEPFMPMMVVPGIGGLLEHYGERMDVHRRALGVISLCFGDPSVVPQHRIDEAAVEIEGRRGMPWVGEAFLRSLRGLVGSYVRTGEASMWRMLTRIHVPSLVVWGDRDRLVDVALAPRVARSLTDSRLLVLNGVGHVAQLEDAVSTARVVLALLEDARRGVGQDPELARLAVGS